MEDITSSSNQHEKTLAWNDHRRAVETLALVYALPQDIGARIQWNNGVIWERVGDNEWLALESTQLGIFQTPKDTRTHPSDHITRDTWKRVN